MYIGETKRNVSIRVNEHEKWNGNSEPAKHLIKYPTHAFKWSLYLQHHQIREQEKTWNHLL